MCVYSLATISLNLRPLALEREKKSVMVSLFFYTQVLSGLYCLLVYTSFEGETWSYHSSNLCWKKIAEMQ